MALNLTEWWEALLDDLSKLESKGVISTTESISKAWDAATTMAKEGAKIEDLVPSPAALGCKTKIEAAAKNLGTTFTNPVNKEKENLPDVNDPHQFIFALTYYHHLLRYSDITKGGFLVLPGVQKEMPRTQQAAIELKQRIDAFCAIQDNVKNTQLAFPELALQQGASLLEQAENWLAEKSLEEKLITQFEADAITIVQNFKTKPHDQTETEDDSLYESKEESFTTENIDFLYSNLESQLRSKEATLREIAVYKELLEKLNNGSIRPEDLKDEQSLIDALPLTSPEHIEEVKSRWMDIYKAVPESALPNAVGRYMVRGALGLATGAAQLGNFAVRWTLGYISDGLNSRASEVVNFISNAKDSVTPLTPEENRKNLLIVETEKHLSSLAAEVNSDKDKPTISIKDFKDMSSGQVIELADKVATIRRMVQIQKCLEEFRKETSKEGIVKFTQKGIIKNITNLLSKTFLRPLIYNKILLTQEAEALDKKLTKMIDLAKKAESFDKDSVTEELKKTLDETEETSKKIYKESIFTHFFKEETKGDSEKLEKIVSTAKSKMGN